MSYPRRIHTLIIDDASIARKNYQNLFNHLSANYDVAPPCLVPSYNDAQECLASREPFHLVIVDLQLPLTAGEDPEPGTQAGLALIKQAAERENFPVPALLVVSGQLAETRYILQDQLRENFWYGRAVNKSVDEDEAIEEAIKQCQRYTDVGIHLFSQESEATYPPLSPREDDMLRRCVLGQSQCLGLLFSWWSATSNKSGEGTQSWTKVLQGKFCLDDGRGCSRPLFFKFTGADGADYTHKDCLTLSSKLPHIKVVHHAITPRKALLVTEKVGAGDARPTSLASYLQRSDPKVLETIPGIVQAIVNQLDDLGRVIPDEISYAELVWKDHDRNRLEAAWKRFGGNIDLEPCNSPLKLFDELLNDQRREWVKFRNCTHGDLNITNIAIDEGGEQVNGYIFDAAGMGRKPAAQDLAALEVTAILHQTSPTGKSDSLNESLVDRCVTLYETTMPIPDLLTSADFLAINTVALVTAIRNEARRYCTQSTYALLVFDQALIQLGGLTYTLSGNKITIPEEAARLVARTASWTRNIVSS